MDAEAKLAAVQALTNTIASARAEVETAQASGDAEAIETASRREDEASKELRRVLAAVDRD